MGEADFPPVIACEKALMQAGRLLYPLGFYLLRNRSH